MADYVEQAMQEMIPELDDLRRKRIFKDPEIREIVKRRRDFEYATQKQSRTPQDYLNYIRYEVALECLRRRRSTARKWKRKSLSDNTGVRRLVSLFDRCVMRFRADKRLWYQYIDFCLRSGSTSILSGVLNRAVKFHPREVQFWLLAADRELKCGHVQAARTLLTRGLRCMPRSAKLWSEFFRLEVQVARRLLEVRAGSVGGAAASAAPIESAWAPAGLLLRRGLSRLAASPRSCAALLTVATDCVGQARAASGAQEGLGTLAEELRAAIADHRPGTPGKAQWTEVNTETASKLWELWWTGERAANGDWRTIAEDVVAFAPPAVVQQYAAVLAEAGGPAHLDDTAQKALFAVAAAPCTASDADAALAVLEALEDCSESQPSPESAAALRILLQNAAKLHPSCARLAILARKQLASDGHAEDAGSMIVLAQKTCNLEPSQAAQLLLLALRSDDKASMKDLDSPMAAGGDAVLPGAVPELLEALLRRLAPEASPRPLMDALLTHALGEGPAALRAAVGAAAACAARLWDTPGMRARLLAAALDAELRACGQSTGTVEEAQQVSRRFEEVLVAFEGIGGEEPTEWWLRYREFVECTERRGLGAGVPRSMDLHWRAMRSVTDQARYSEQAHRRLQASPA